MGRTRVYTTGKNSKSSVQKGIEYTYQEIEALHIINSYYYFKETR